MDNPLFDDEIDGSSGKLPGKPAADCPEIPTAVSSAASMTKLLALYALLISISLSLIGAFVGPQILIPGVLHAVLGTLLIFARNGLLHQRRWARWLLIGLAALGEVTLLMMIVQVSMEGVDVVGPMILIGVLAVNFALIVWWLTTESARVWFLKSGRP